MVLTAYYLRNRMPVTGRNITPYESKTGFQPQLGHLRHIVQQGYAQDRKPNTVWKKFADRATAGILVGYEGDHIYRMLMSNGKVMRFSKVEWIDNTPLAISPPPSPSTVCASPSPPPNPSNPSSSPLPNSNERQCMDWEWDFLTPQMFPSSPTISPSSKRANLHIGDETDNYPIALRSTTYPTKDISFVTRNNADDRPNSTLQPNTRLTRNQAH